VSSRKTRRFDVFQQDDIGCWSCKWWSPHPDSETGICRSVLVNDYACADLVHDETRPGRIMLQTHADFLCSDYDDIEEES
jgi:hypothetical protein